MDEPPSQEYSSLSPMEKELFNQLLLGRFSDQLKSFSNATSGHFANIELSCSQSNSTTLPCAEAKENLNRVQIEMLQTVQLYKQEVTKLLEQCFKTINQPTAGAQLIPIDDSEASILSIFGISCLSFSFSLFTCLATICKINLTILPI